MSDMFCFSDGEDLEQMWALWLKDERELSEGQKRCRKILKEFVDMRIEEVLEGKGEVL